jgi:molybdenum cofactor cytidylyltransferase
MKPRPAVIVLAAGTGSRFGANGHKLTQRLGTSSVLATTLRHAIASHSPMVHATTWRRATW